MPLVYVFAAMKSEARPLEQMLARQAGLSSATRVTRQIAIKFHNTGAMHLVAKGRLVSIAVK